MAKRANVTSLIVPSDGLIPAIPATRKYVLVKSKRGETESAVMVVAALISASPTIISWSYDEF